ncbi:hypothetical protein [Mucisphaera sp.]|uniref:hypothetical protein n=1 Tax=Mucisphaera sp. TaxID=2913024 RepID=UPI003D0D297E
MNYYVTRIGVVRAGVVCAGLYFLLALIFLPFAILGGAFQAVQGQPGPALGAVVVAIVAAVFYPLLGFISGVIAAFVYNVVARFTGGLSMVIEAEEDYTQGFEGCG